MGVTCGVPQGTILGPLVYINDLRDIISPDNIVAFADDTAIVSSGQNWCEVADVVNLYLLKVADWLTLNRLTLNIDKSEFIAFANYNDKLRKNIEIKVGSHYLIRVYSTKYLGITVDQNLKWKPQIHVVVKRLRYLLLVFAKSKSICNKRTLTILYYALFNSLATYGIEVGGICVS